jgi:hypothetical protein
VHKRYEACDYASMTIEKCFRGILLFNGDALCSFARFRMSNKGGGALAALLYCLHTAVIVSWSRILAPSSGMSTIGIDKDTWDYHYSVTQSLGYLYAPPPRSPKSVLAFSSGPGAPASAPVVICHSALLTTDVHSVEEMRTSTSRLLVLLVVAWPRCAYKCSYHDPPGRPRTALLARCFCSSLPVTVALLRAVVCIAII